MKKILLVLFCFAIIHIRPAAAEEWLVSKGYFCTLYLKPEVNLQALNDKIDTYGVNYGLSEKPAQADAGLSGDLTYKFDLIFLKTQEVLDMRPDKIRMDAKVYLTKDEIGRIYMEIYDEKADFIAFYSFKLNTLFACQEKISAGILAHEMAHCILDHHFEVAPPKKIAEMLAQYAELHLRA